MSRVSILSTLAGLLIFAVPAADAGGPKINENFNTNHEFERHFPDNRYDFQVWGRRWMIYVELENGEIQEFDYYWQARQWVYLTEGYSTADIVKIPQDWELLRTFDTYAEAERYEWGARISHLFYDVEIRPVSEWLLYLVE